MHKAVKRVGRNHRQSSHWSVYLTSKTYLSPVLRLFASTVGGRFVAHTTDVFARWSSSAFLSGCTGVVRQALFRTVDRSWSRGSWVVATTVTGPYSDIDFHLWSSMKNEVYANIVHTRQQLWQRIQDAANEIRNRAGVFERVRTSRWRMCWCPLGEFRAFVATYVTSKSSLSHIFRISDMLEHKSLDILSYVTFHRTISGPVFIDLFDSYWRPEAPLPFMPHHLETPGSFPGGKARPGRDADHSPPSSAEVKNE
jgi:hypothetical protein